MRNDKKGLKEINFYKFDCHRMMKEMWKTNTKAYTWLLFHAGYGVHFSEIHDIEEVKRIHALLLERYDRKITNKQTKV